MSPGTPYTRQEFEALRASANVLRTREGRWLLVVSVGLGVAQLGFIRWADRHLDRRAALPWEGGFFLVYLALVGWLLIRMIARLNASRLSCPQCGAHLGEMSVRVAAATGNCDQCGGKVVQP